MTTALTPGLIPPPLATATEAVQRRRIAETAQAFEASFLSVMINQMFSGLDTEGPFSGGAGEAAFQSFLGDAIARQITRSGGVGLAAPVQAEMLKLQGLT
ncbi:MAG: rod-binding protein [Phenylobacterium sp.]|uniref:rod-binding protein n=1 Tax=Phenylobacterium sp. TaxID=1871053 RepID=UPI0025E547D7|nr:rod-binding protein [Phenylobacterium sp.]MCA6228083.1 rod-binding protein [Phenylobacterium sp.]MCA6231442.1 rod-binding protein [Phenylobacterium sp.]MCA6233709.1 rod-binding protein [Phenylobacterium sp.]MCA6249529.1 rod-binding protein [Phenylobacterium sp.]MCA6252658.1 rod-binding protein [Phenylobacterium sp.]